MNSKLEQIKEMLETAKQQVELKAQTDHAYVNGNIDGWREALNYLSNLLNEAMKEDTENDVNK